MSLKRAKKSDKYCYCNSWNSDIKKQPCINEQKVFQLCRKSLRATTYAIEKLEERKQYEKR